MVSHWRLPVAFILTVIFPPLTNFHSNLIHYTTTQFLETVKLSHCLRNFLNKSKASSLMNWIRKDSSIIKVKHIYLFGRFIVYRLAKIIRMIRGMRLHVHLNILETCYQRTQLNATLTLFSCKIICFLMWPPNTFRTIVHFLVKCRVLFKPWF